MSGINQAFSEMAAFTLRDQNNTVTSSIRGLNAFFDELEGGSGIKKSVSGGEFISRGVSLLENPTLSNFEGYGTFDTNASETSTVVTAPWRNKACVVKASGPELRMNSGKNKLKDLVKLRTDVAKDTIANHMDVEVHGDGSASSSLYGLAYWLTDDGLGSPGGVDATTYRNWRNQWIEMTGTNNPASIISDMNKLYNRCTFSGTQPNLALLSTDLFEAYQNAVTDKIRYTDTKDAQGSKYSLRHHNAKIVRCLNANFGETSERGYFLTTKHWELFVHPDADWKDGGERMPINADAVLRPMIWMGNLICTSRRTQGVLKDTA